MIRVLALSICLCSMAAYAQIPTNPSLPVQTNHFGAAAVLGTNLAWSNDVATTNRTTDLVFDPSPTPGVTYIIGKGRLRGIYTLTNQIGTNTNAHYPPPVPPTALTIAYADKTLIKATNPPGALLFRACISTNVPDTIFISSSSNGSTWTRFTLLMTTGRNFTITRQ